MNYYIPIVIVVGSNIIYNICAKSTPSSANALASLLITYLTAAIGTIVLLLFNHPFKEFFAQFKELNWTSFVLGLSIIGLEFGYIQIYRVGWNISVGSLVANICLAISLILIGLMIYKEHISINQITGIVLCLIGLIFINKK